MSNNRKSLRLFIIFIPAAILLVFAGIVLRNGNRMSGIPELTASTTEVIEQQIKDARRKCRFRGSASNLGKLGMAYHANTFYAQAAACYEKAMELEPDNWLWSYYAGYLALEMGQSEKVITLFEKVLELDPGKTLALYYLGEARRNLRESAKAELSFRKILEEHPEFVSGNPEYREDYFPLSVYAAYRLSNIMMEEDRLEEAENMLKGIINRHRMYGPAYRSLGNLYRMQGKEELSAGYLLRANDLMLYAPPVDPMVDKLALLSRSEAFLLQKTDDAINGIHSEWAIRILDHSLEYIQDNKYLYSKAIKTCIWMGQNQKAIEMLPLHLSLASDEYKEIYDMALFLFEKTLYSVSLEYFRVALEMDPGELNLKKHLAIALWRTGNRDESLGQLGQILNQHPNDPEMLAEITSLIIFELGDMELAASYFPVLEKSLPDHPETRKISAYMAEKEGRIGEAISMYASVMIDNPADLVVIKRLGLIFIKQNNWQAAVGHYRLALKQHPNEPFILERLGTLLIVCPDESLQNIGEGMMYAERAFVHTSSTPLIKISAGRNLAMAYAMVGDRQNAITTIRSAITIAKQQNYSEERIAELEQLEQQFQGLAK